MKSIYLSMTALLASVGLILLAIVDFRRGFLLSKSAYLYKNPFFLFHPLQVAMIVVGLIGVLWVRRSMKGSDQRMANVLLIGLFVLLLIDAALYRGVAASRSLDEGKIGLGWLTAWGVTGLVQPLALAASYVLTVWHATVLSCLGAGLGLLALPRIFRRAAAAEGWRGSFSGAAYALTQPFCSCCAAMTSPSLFRKSQSTNFALAVFLGAPLMNLSTLTLAGNLLPWPYALLRIVGGLIVTLILSFLIARWIDVTPVESREVSMAVACDTDAPSDLLVSWLKLSGRVALILVPAMIVGTMLSSVMWSFWPKGLGNSVGSVVLTSLVGTLVMVSTWSEIPLASQMIQSGLTGPAAAALVALPAVNLGSVLIIGKVARSWTLALALCAGVIVTSVAVGIAFL